MVINDTWPGRCTGDGIWVMSTINDGEIDGIVHLDGFLTDHCCNACKYVWHGIWSVEALPINSQELLGKRDERVYQHW